MSTEGGSQHFKKAGEIGEHLTEKSGSEPIEKKDCMTRRLEKGVWEEERGGEEGGPLSACPVV